VLSPDGKRIAFSLSLPTEMDRNRIWIADADGANAKKLTREGVLQHEPAWSPDGRFLYYSAGDGGQSHDLRRLEVATGAMEQLTAGELYHFDVAVSGAGDLAFSSNRSGNYEIWVMREGAKEPFALTDDPGADGRPSWAPDGQTIAFDSTRGGRPNVWSVRVGAKGPEGEPVPLTEHPVGARAPAYWGGER
jgi:Tol biopolymer transport system component